MAPRVLVADDSPTIRKVVASILERHGFEALQAEDGQAALELVEHEKVDLVLLDFVMPRMNGLQFCHALREVSEREVPPVVLMSAKGDKIRGPFLKQAGAIDAITKPFDARGLIAVVEGALARSAAETTSTRISVVDFPNRGSSPSLAEEVPTSVAGPPFAALFAELLAPALGALGEEATVHEALRSAATPELQTALGELIAAAASDAPPAALAGDIAVISTSEILQLLQLQRQSGLLVVTSRGRRITIHVNAGAVALATSEGLRGEFLLGRYLVDAGAIARPELERALLEPAPGEPLGARLVAQGKISARQLARALERQTSELVYECVRWTSGRFRYLAALVAAEVSAVALALPVGALIMEGFRRVDEWRLIEGSLNFDQLLARDETTIDQLLDPNTLTPREREVLARIDGAHTVREIVDAVEGSSFEVCKIVYQFLNSHLVRRIGA